MRQAVAHYRAAGWAAIRVQPASKAPIGEWRDRTDEAAQFADGENVGVRLGEPSGGLVDVDLDCDEAVRLAPLFLPETSTFGRPSKLRSHWLYQCPGLRTRKPSRCHIEIRSTGVQTVLPPSIHESGEQIAWTDSTPLVAIGETELLRCVGKLIVATLVARAWPELTGNRHDAVLALAGALWHEGLSADDAAALLLPAMELDGSAAEHREQAIRDTWSDDTDRNRYGWPTVATLVGELEAKAIERAVEWIKPPKAEVRDQAGRPLTDLGNAERLIDQHGENLKYVPGLKWICWDDTRWVPTPGEPIDLAASSARLLQAQGTEQGQPPIAKWGFQSESEGRLRAAVRLARDMPAIQCAAQALDADPWLICCPNGRLDLRTGLLREHDRNDYMTKMVAVPYEPRALAPRFVQFLAEVFDEAAVASYVLRFLGYSLTGNVSEQVFQLWHGHGSNGKSVLVDVVRYVLGDYAQILAGDLLVKRRQGRSSEAASPDVARLRGCRFAAGVETEEGQRWNESLVKQLTGSDRIVARHLHQESIEFDPTWKLVLAVNHKPIVRGTDRGMWRRIHLVPFEQTFTGPRADPHLTQRLRGEGPGILAMLVRACLEWQREGLCAPERVRAAGEDYRAGQDVVGSFLSECVGPGEGVSKSRLFQAYRKWAIDGGEYLKGKHAFNNDLRERGYQDSRTSDGVIWRGMGLLSDRSFGVQGGS